MNNIAMEQLEGKLIFSLAIWQNYRGTAKIALAFEEKQFTRFICINYRGKQNRSVLGTNE